MSTKSQTYTDTIVPRIYLTIAPKCTNAKKFQHEIEQHHNNITEHKVNDNTTVDWKFEFTATRNVVAIFDFQ